VHSKTNKFIAQQDEHVENLKLPGRTVLGVNYPETLSLGSLRSMNFLMDFLASIAKKSRVQPKHDSEEDFDIGALSDRLSARITCFLFGPSLGLIPMMAKSFNCRNEMLWGSHR
jgi:hypothetical protein